MFGLLVRSANLSKGHFESFWTKIICVKRETDVSVFAEENKIKQIAVMRLTYN
jgi:hypothetical protein